MESSKEISEENFNEESCGAILSVAKDLYQDELDRSKQLEKKTAITLAFVGIILSLHLSVILNEDYMVFLNTKINTMFYCVEILILFGFVVSTFCLLRTVTLSDFKQLQIDNIVNMKDATSDAAQVKINIAATYQTLINHNINVINMKTERYDLGIKFLIITLSLFFLISLIKGVVNYVQ